jgi:hypothetical protein
MMMATGAELIVGKGPLATIREKKARIIGTVFALASGEDSFILS